ncbi:MAG TPA: hypothetical protein VE441_09795 [Mycobacterium sp.]|nr:hypothetical protein [Mycobacterium sp.]
MPTGPRRDELLTARQAAARLGIAVETLINWHLRGSGPPFAATHFGQLACWAGDLEKWQDRVIEIN